MKLGDPNQADDLAVGLRVSRRDFHLVDLCLARSWNEAVKAKRADVANEITRIATTLRSQAELEGMRFEGPS